MTKEGNYFLSNLIKIMISLSHLLNTLVNWGQNYQELKNPAFIDILHQCSKSHSNY